MLLGNEVLSKPIVRHDLVKVAILLAALGLVRLYGNHRYTVGLVDMAKYIMQNPQKLQQHGQENVPDKEWGMGSTK